MYTMPVDTPFDDALKLAKKLVREGEYKRLMIENDSNYGRVISLLSADGLYWSQLYAEYAELHDCIPH